MGRRAKGFRHKSRSILTRKPRERGKTSLTKILRGFESGEKVAIKIDPSVHNGMPHRRFHGKTGVVIAMRGRSYVVHVSQGDSIKEIIVRPEHMSTCPNNMEN